MNFIGRVKFKVGGRPQQAILDRKAGWKIPTKDSGHIGKICKSIEDNLNSDPTLNLEGWTPDQGRVGYSALNRVSRELNGKAYAPNHPDPTPGVIY